MILCLIGYTEREEESCDLLSWPMKGKWDAKIPKDYEKENSVSFVPSFSVCLCRLFS